jgi:hypothetical protein
MIKKELNKRKTLHKNRAGGVAQGKGPEFKPQYSKKKSWYILPPHPHLYPPKKYTRKNSALIALLHLGSGCQGTPLAEVHTWTSGLR